MMRIEEVIKMRIEEVMPHVAVVFLECERRALSPAMPGESRRIARRGGCSVSVQQLELLAAELETSSAMCL
jgi:hypothetical protein